MFLFFSLDDWVHSDILENWVQLKSVLGGGTNTALQNTYDESH